MGAGVLDVVVYVTFRALFIWDRRVCVRNHADSVVVVVVEIICGVVPW